jgi:hypothetical protein
MADVGDGLRFAAGPIQSARRANVGGFALLLVYSSPARCRRHNLICVISAIGPSALSAIASPPRPPQPPAPVGHASGQLVDDEVTDLTDIPAIGSIDRGSVDVFARNASMGWMSSCACHHVPPCNGLLPFDHDVPQPITDWTHGRCAISSHDENPAGFGKRISPPPAANGCRNRA